MMISMLEQTFVMLLRSPALLLADIAYRGCHGSCERVFQALNSSGLWNESWPVSPLDYVSYTFLPLSFLLVLSSKRILFALYRQNLLTTGLLQLGYTVCQLYLRNNADLTTAGNFVGILTSWLVVALPVFYVVMRTLRMGIPMKAGWLSAATRFLLPAYTIPMITCAAGVADWVTNWTNRTVCLLVMIISVIGFIADILITLCLFFVEPGVSIFPDRAGYEQNAYSLECTKLFRSTFHFSWLFLFASCLFDSAYFDRVSEDSQLLSESTIQVLKSAAQNATSTPFSFFGLCFSFSWTVDSILHLLSLFLQSSINIDVFTGGGYAAVSSTLMFALDMSFFGFSVSGNVHLLLLTTFGLTLPHWIFAIAEPAFASAMISNRHSQRIRVLLVYAVVFSAPPLLTYVIYRSVGVLHWAFVTILPSLMMCIAVIRSVAEHIVSEIDNRYDQPPWADVEDVIARIRKTSMYTAWLVSGCIIVCAIALFFSVSGTWPVLFKIFNVFVFCIAVPYALAMVAEAKRRETRARVEMYPHPTECDPRLDDQCSICLVELRGTRTTRKIPCGHVFHERCLLKWLGVNMTCPHCRFNLQTVPGTGLDLRQLLVRQHVVRTLNQMMSEQAARDRQHVSVLIDNDDESLMSVFSE